MNMASPRSAGITRISWDYPGGEVGFMRAFRTEAVALGPAARDLTEDRRFQFCTPQGLAELTREAGLPTPEVTAIEASSVFRGFEDYWHPFTLGVGPAPSSARASRPRPARLRTGCPPACRGSPTA